MRVYSLRLAPHWEAVLCRHDDPSCAVNHYSENHTLRYQDTIGHLKASHFRQVPLRDDRLCLDSTEHEFAGSFVNSHSPFRPHRPFTATTGAVFVLNATPVPTFANSNIYRLSPIYTVTYAFQCSQPFSPTKLYSRTKLSSNHSTPGQFCTTPPKYSLPCPRSLADNDPSTREIQP